MNFPLLLFSYVKFVTDVVDLQQRWRKYRREISALDALKGEKV
jgi:uncharacterized protein YjiS (DUF1127 family)